MRIIICVGTDDGKLARVPAGSPQGSEMLRFYSEDLVLFYLA